MTLLALLLALPLCAEPAPSVAADTAAPTTNELLQDADVLAAMSDSDFITNAGRAKSKIAAAPTQGQSLGDGTSDVDSRLSRPRSLSMVYETLAAAEYQQAADTGLLAPAELQTASRRVSAYAGHKAKLAGVRARVKAYRSQPQAVGRAVGVQNKRLSRLKASLAGVDKELRDPAVPAARKAQLHVKAGRIYEDMASAAKYAASVAVVEASVLDDSGTSSAVQANDATDHPNDKARKVASAPKKSKPKARVADAVAPDAPPPPSEEDEVRQGIDDMSKMGSDMHQLIDQRKQTGQ